MKQPTDFVGGIQDFLCKAQNTGEQSLSYVRPPLGRSPTVKEGSVLP